LSRNPYDELPEVAGSAAAPAILGFIPFSHSLGRAMIVPVHEENE
jgi:hypothetical protein